MFKNSLSVNEFNTPTPQLQMPLKPDIAVPFEAFDYENTSAFVIAARPKTNTLTYESIILRAIAPYIELLYMANLNGNVVQNCQIIQSQYSSQFKFAKEGKKRVRKYPEMVKRFEEKFKIDFETAPIIGSLEAVTTYREEIKKSSEELFQIMVEDKDFLLMYGQTIKRIGAYFIINYDIPAIFHKHNQHTNIYVIAAKLEDCTVPFSVLNHKIYEGLIQHPRIQIIDRYSHQNLAWYNQVRRTYHISNSHIKAMFDMTDYIVGQDLEPIGFNQTPLGNLILNRGKVNVQNLQALKKDPLVRVQTKSGHKLMNILVDSFNPDHPKSLVECCELIERVQFV